MDTLLLGSISAIGLAGIVAAERWNQRRIYQDQRKQVRYFRILPHADITLDPARIIRMVEQLAGYKRSEVERFKKGREWYRFLIHKGKDGQIAFYFSYPQDRQTGIKRTLSSVYPEAELHDVAHEDVPLPSKHKSGESYSGMFVLREKGEKEGLPLHSFDIKNDYWPDVLASMEAGEKDSEVWLDLVFSPTHTRELKKAVERAANAIHPQTRGDHPNYDLKSFGKAVLEEFTSNGAPRKHQKPIQSHKKAELDFDELERLRALKRRYTGREDAFHVSLALHVEAPYAPGIAQTVGTTLSSMMSFDNGLRLVRVRKRIVADLCPIPRRHQLMLWTGQELANILHLPPGTHRIYKYIPHLARGQRSLGKHELTEGVSIGNLQHPLQQGRRVSIPYEQFTKHFVLTGMTGSGKSSTALMMVQSLLDQWIKDPDRAPGLSYFDPARETVATILTRLLKAELDGAHIPWEKVHYAYLGPTEYPLGLNLLHYEGQSISVVAKEVLGLLKYAYAGDTPRMDRLVENALLTLLEDRKQHTIMGIVPVLTDEDFRNRILPNVKDPIIRQFWSRKIDDAGIDPILNRLSPLITDITMRRMFGQKKWSLNIRKMMDEGHIFLWDLLNVSKENVKLAAGHLAMQYHQTAKTRSSASRLHVLAYDEAHLVQIPIMEKIIAEDRKFGLCLGLITQYISQFQPWLVDAITENVGTILTCTQGPKSAAAITTMTAGSFDKDYLQKLPERIVAVYTKTKNEDRRSEVTTFTVTSDPPYMYMDDGQIANHESKADIQRALNWALKKGNELQARDGTHYSLVDKEIEEYLNYKTALKDDEDASDERMPWDY